MLKALQKVLEPLGGFTTKPAPPPNATVAAPAAKASMAAPAGKATQPPPEGKTSKPPPAGKAMALAPPPLKPMVATSKGMPAKAMKAKAMEPKAAQAMEAMPANLKAAQSMEAMPAKAMEPKPHVPQVIPPRDRAREPTPREKAGPRKAPPPGRESQGWMNKWIHLAGHLHRGDMASARAHVAKWSPRTNGQYENHLARAAANNGIDPEM